ncbi:sulfite exporter TauE/SafE family protein [Oceanicoccus sagamiensis]|uniref:Probable membrane transporter protein n=1 Tax=Oceanicoccus sagamiensis TaxID=716816 RepID=A0A1X9NMC3_9GAMM|nr:sulfite exporter TauE/SafE family protein [Oceanicoccus sagamiensis]ARN75063.1 permease [Oceanicoccus sagamiensis]
MDIALEHIVLLMITGLLAGVINTLAGGGSNLTLPALMVMGMPADIANATNRVAVTLQNVVAMQGFYKHDKLPTDDLIPILLPTLIGGFFGAIGASYAPEWVLKPLLLGVMLSMTVIMLVKPSVISPPLGTIPHKVKDKTSAWWWLAGAGFYAGFIQAGVGFILITALAGSLRYDLVRTNALKVVCVLVPTVVALAVFTARGQVLWLPGMILAVGSMAGAYIAVKFAITAKPSTLKWFLFIMTLCGSAAVLLF